MNDPGAFTVAATPTGPSAASTASAATGAACLIVNSPTGQPMGDVRKIAGYVTLTWEQYEELRHTQKLAAGFTYRPCDHCGKTIEQGLSGAYWHMNLPDSLACPQMRRIDGSDG